MTNKTILDEIIEETRIDKRNKMSKLQLLSKLQTNIAEFVVYFMEYIDINELEKWKERDGTDGKYDTVHLVVSQMIAQLLNADAETTKYVDKEDEEFVIYQIGNFLGANVANNLNGLLNSMYMTYPKKGE